MAAPFIFLATYFVLAMGRVPGLRIDRTGAVVAARQRIKCSVDQAQHAAQRERAALWEAGAAVREALFGNVSDAKERARAALAFSTNREVEYEAAFALGLTGHSDKSQTLASDLSSRFPDDTLLKFNRVPSVRAQLALNTGEPSKALDVLTLTVSYELSPTRGTVGALYPVYVRGEAYLAAHQGNKAAAEFQRILDHRGIVVNDPIGAVARLQLARAFVEAEDEAKAKSAYQDFLTLWKDADPDIPILKQAKLEYSKLP